MIVRPFNPATDSIDHLDPEGIDLDRDFVVVVQSDCISSPHIVGIMAWRVVAYVHNLKTEDGNPIARRIVEKMLDYSRGMGKVMKVPECIFKTDKDNKTFLAYMQNQGAWKQEEKDIFHRLETE
jgi:hypothetical protein